MHTKNEIDYIMTAKPSMVTDVTVINRINIGIDHNASAWASEMKEETLL